MEFIERVVPYKGKCRLTKVDENNVPISNKEPYFVNIVKEEGTPTVEGTLLNAELLKKANWREDDSLSFKARTSIPSSEIDTTQIYTNKEGLTFLIPPGENRQPVEIGKVTGTTITIDEQEQDSFDLKAKLRDFVYPVGSIYMSANNVSPQTFIGGNWESWGMGRVPLGVGTPQANDYGLNTTTPSNNYASAEIRGGLENSTASHTHSTPDHTHTLAVSVSHNWTSSGGSTSGGQSNGHTHSTPPHTHSIFSHSRASANVSSIAGGNSNNNSTLGGPDTKGTNSGSRDTYIGLTSGTNKIIDPSTGGGTSGEVSQGHTHSTPNHVHTLSSSAIPSWTTSGGGTSGNSSVLETRGNLQPYITCYMWKRTN